ncbi:hypothetical protein ACWENQ_43710 [Nonomuraea sp. NPDC004354]
MSEAERPEAEGQRLRAKREYPERGEDPRAVKPVARPGVETVICHEGLVRALAEQFARADTSLRELETRADKAGRTRLPRTTCADMLAGRRFPKKAVMVAFLRACQVPEDQLPAWEQAWERVRVARIPARPEENPGIESSSGAPSAAAQTAEPSQAGPARIPSRGWRQAFMPTVLVTLAVAAALSVIIHQQKTPERITPDGFGSPVDPGHIISDDGRAFGPGGSSRFTATIDPANTGVRLVRRLDVGVAWQHASITVNGNLAGVWRPLPGDSIYKWRDQVVEIPRTLTAGRRSLTIANTFVSSSEGFNEFRYVIEQKVNGTWTTADRLDVGHLHAASEAAHDYHIVAQGWADTQTFAYPPRKQDWRVD